MSKTKFQAVRLRTLMVAIVIIMAGISIGGFYYAQNWFNNFVSDKMSKSHTPTPTTPGSTNDSASTQQLTQPQQAANVKASDMIMSTNGYKSRIMQDLNKYASDTGVTISNNAETQVAPSATTTPLPNGIKPNYITITVANPVQYTSLLKFINAIETNIPKMKLMGITINHIEDTKNSVTVEPITIEVYTR